MTSKIPADGGVVREQQPPDYPRDEQYGFTPPFVRGTDHLGKVDSTGLDPTDKGKMAGSTRGTGQSA